MQEDPVAGAPGPIPSQNDPSGCRRIRPDGAGGMPGRSTVHRCTPPPHFPGPGGVGVGAAPPAVPTRWQPRPRNGRCSG